MPMPDTYELHAIEELPQSADLAAAVGGVGVLWDGQIQAHLGKSPGCAGGVLSDRTP